MGSCSGGNKGGGAAASGGGAVQETKPVLNIQAKDIGNDKGGLLKEIRKTERMKAKLEKLKEENSIKRAELLELYINKKGYSREKALKKVNRIHERTHKTSKSKRA